jgi:amidase
VPSLRFRLLRGGASVLAVAACVTALLPAAQQSRTFDLEEATIASLQDRMEAGRDSARSLTEKYLARINALDRQGPALRSIIEINPDALTIADELDAERKRRGPRGPLHGIPIVIKDNIATADRMMTTAGSLALEGVRPPGDAFIVTRLRNAGAVILGKTNLSEWANFRSSHSSSGWSARGGQTRNPYALDRNPSGSSSGSAVAVAANLAAAAVGTETDGSIVSPAQTNSLVGIKPTVGLLSRSGIVPISHSQDTAGPMARTVADAAALLGALAGPDPADEVTKAQNGAPDYSSVLDPDGLRGARIGVVRKGLFGNHVETDRLAEAAIAVLKARGAVLVDPADIPTLDSFKAAEIEVLLYEFKADLNKYLAWLGPASPVRSLKDLIAFNEARRNEELVYFGQELFTMAEGKGPLTSAEYTTALASSRRSAGELGIDAVMAKYQLDALVGPTGGPAWLIDLVNGDSGYVPGPSGITAVAGYPHITVPAGYFRGLPVGVSFFGRAWSEPTLIRLAYAYEQATKHRRPPTFAPTASLSQR